PFDKAADKLFKSLRAINNTSTETSKVEKASSLLDFVKARDRSSSDRAGKKKFGASKGNPSKLAINGVIQAVKHVQRYAGALCDSAIVTLKLASKPTVLVEKEVLDNEITLTSQSHDENDSDFHKQKRRRSKSGKTKPDYSDQMFEEENDFKVETRKRSRNNVDNVFEDQEELGDGSSFVSEDAPYPRKNQTRPFKVISEMFKKDFRRCADDYINSEVKTMLIEIGNISDVSAAKSFVSKYKELESFDFDLASVIQNDKQKIIVLMQNQITKIHNLLKEVDREDEIKEIEVYGIVTSSK
ncbi:15364_t:CDS:2, partial [Racocetra fulgida]